MSSSSNTAGPAGFQPAYRSLPADEVRRRGRQALDLMRPCRACPRRCGADRMADQPGVCLIGRNAVVSSFFPHHGEEPCISGWHGSGTIFFSGCNLRCVFCQNSEISQRVSGQPVTASQLANMMRALQLQGCHNINWVSPAHVVPQLLEAMPAAIEAGLNLPIVYNTNGYDGPEALALLDGIVDIYMPDFKIWGPKPAETLLTARDYAKVARQALLQMHRQVGRLQIGPDGLARRGLLIRHLVLPGLLESTREILRWIAENLGPDTSVNLMDQYQPSNRACDYDHICQPLSRSEFHVAQQMAEEFGLRCLDSHRRPV